MNPAVIVPRYTLDNYLATEPEREVRHEYSGGEIFAMAGASWCHNLIVSNLSATIHSHLRGTPYRVIANDRKVLVAKTESVYYPDLLVRCNIANEDIDDYTETKPRLIIEVFSPSTEQIDRREKRLAYQQLESLQDYILVAQDQAFVEIYHRAPDSDIWHYTEYHAEDTVKLASIDLDIPLSTIYEYVDLDNISKTQT